MVYTLRFFNSKCSLFHNSNVFGSCIIHILYTGCAKIKKIISAPKDSQGLNLLSRTVYILSYLTQFLQYFCMLVSPQKKSLISLNEFSLNFKTQIKS